MIIAPGFTQIAYFRNKFKKKYYVIGEVTRIWSVICPEPNKKTDVCLFLVKAYAGTGEYFRKQGIPLTIKKFKEAFPGNPCMIFKDTPVDLRKQTKYIRKKVRTTKKSFLFYVRCALSSWKKVGNDRVFKPISIHYALLPLVHKGIKPRRFEELDPSLGYSQKIADFIRTRLWSDLAKEDIGIVMPYKAYLRYLYKIANLIYDFHEKEIITVADIERLNSYKPPKDNPLEEFIYSFLYEFKQYLHKRKKLGACPVCGSVFVRKKGKVYCRKECSKSRWNAKYYGKHTRILRIRKRRSNKFLRKKNRLKKRFNPSVIDK